MAWGLAFADGARHYALADLGKKYQTVAGSVSFATGRAAHGSQALRFGGGGSYVDMLRPLYGPGQTNTVFSTNGVRWSLGRSLYVPSFASPTWLQIADIYGANIGGLFDPATRQSSLWLGNDGTLSVRRGATEIAATAAGAFPFDTWVRLEHAGQLDGDFHALTGIVEVRVNGTQVLYVDNQIVSEDGKGYVHYARVGNIAADGNTVEIDQADAYLLLDASSGATFLHWGDVYVGTLWPTGPGTRNDWEPSTAANWTLVADGTPDGDTSYVRTPAATWNEDTYTFGPVPLPIAGGKVRALLPTATLRLETNPGTIAQEDFDVFLESGATSGRYTGAFLMKYDAVGTSYVVRQGGGGGSGYASAPDGTPWSAAALADWAIGPATPNTGGTPSNRAARVTQFVLELVYERAARQRSRAYLLA